MTHYLRRNGKTVVDVEASRQDLHSVVDIREFSKLLVISPIRDVPGLIDDFEALQEMRGEFHESVGMEESPDGFARRRLREVGQRYNLQHVTD